MRYRYARYNLELGFIGNWLVAGPQTISLPSNSIPGDQTPEQIAGQFYDPSSGITETPVERGPLTEGIFQVGDYQGSWEYYACPEDHFVDRSTPARAPSYLRSWAYVQLNAKVEQDVVLVLTTHGPTDLWVNDERVLHQEQFFGSRPGSRSIKAALKKGQNSLLVRFEGLTLQNDPLAFALQLRKVTGDRPVDKAQGIAVTIPTLIQALARRKNFEQAALSAYVVQDVFEPTDHFRLKWAEDLKEPSPAQVRLVSDSGPFYAEATVDGTAGDSVYLNDPYLVPEGPYRVIMLPHHWEYYNQNIRITREFPIWNMGVKKFSTAPYKTFVERRTEALTAAAQTKGLFGEIAKMALERWNALEVENILQAMKNPQPVELLGLLGMLARFGESEAFPKELLPALEECILSYPYGQPAGPETSPAVPLAAEILAGQRYPDSTFTHSEKTGQWHRESAEKRALEWMDRCAATGFADWDAPEAFAGHAIALSHLVDLAGTEAVWEMAGVVLDKLFFTLATNSFQGVYGSTRGSTRASFIKGGLLEPTSAITRLLWGTGIFNHHTAGPVSLCCVENYELPSIIADIATSRAEEMWNRERHAITPDHSVNKVTYRTPDYMLSSAQDFCPGTNGRHEHIWQATLGQAAVVFVTHPGSASEKDTSGPGFWAGNAILPRVAQWKDTLIALYQLPVEDWMGFTHAYFPTYAFDEYELAQGWAFARKGEGFIALKASQGFEMPRSGRVAFRELRARGSGIWLCHMGRAAQDGDFKTFKEKVIALDATFEGTRVSCATLRGERLAFGWEGPFLRDGLEQALSGFAHYENPYTTAGYPCSEMEIQADGSILRLDFTGETSSSEQ
jgi:hypothetical protein